MAKAKIPINIDLDTYNIISAMAAKENISRVKLVADHFAGRREALLNKQIEEKIKELEEENEKLREENKQWQAEMEKISKALD